MLAIYQKQFKRKKESVRIYPGGREVCAETPLGRREYRRRTEEMWARQNGICSICNRPMRMEEATFEHDDCRGMAGSHRDDRTEIDGKPYNSAAHGLCNVKKGGMPLKDYLRAGGSMKATEAVL